MLGPALITDRPVRVLLVNAPPFEVVEPWYDTPRFGRHGLACLAGYLRAQPGFEVAVVDAKLERISLDRVAERARAFAPDLVGFTAFTNEIKPAARAAEVVRRAVPRAVTAIGGVHVTALPERTMREFPAFDVGCVGEGERTLHELAASLRTGAPLASIAGLVVRDGDEVRRTPERVRIDDLDELPPPAWDLFPRADEYWVMTQRGCPFTCRFCVNPNGRVPRSHSIERVMVEVESIVARYAPDKLWFADEIFTVNVERASALCEAMIRARIGERVRWWAETHVRFVDEALLRKMRAAGCRECALGIETGDEESLKRMGKGTNVGMVLDAFAAAKRAGLDTIAFFVFGHPNETERSIRATIDLAVRVNPTIPIFGVMVPYPGTDVARLAARGEAGYRLLTDDWDAYNKQIGAALEFAGLSRRAIEALQLRAYVEVFVANRRFGDLARFVWRHRAAGAKLAAKLLARGAHGGPERPPPSASSLAEIAGAADDWAASQVASVKALRRQGAAEGTGGARRLNVVPASPGTRRPGRGASSGRR